MKHPHQDSLDQSLSLPHSQAEIADDQKLAADMMKEADAMLEQAKYISFDSLLSTPAELVTALQQAEHDVADYERTIADRRGHYMTTGYDLLFEDEDVEVTAVLRSELFAAEELTVMEELVGQMSQPFDLQVYRRFCGQIDFLSWIPVKLYSFFRVLLEQHQWDEESALDSGWRSFLREQCALLHDEHRMQCDAMTLPSTVLTMLDEALASGCTDEQFKRVCSYLERRCAVYSHEYTNQQGLHPHDRRRMRRVMRLLPRDVDQIRQLDLAEQEAPNPLWMATVHSQIDRALVDESDYFRYGHVQSKMMLLLGLIFDEESEMMQAEKQELWRRVDNLFALLGEKEKKLTESDVKTLIYVWSGIDEFSAMGMPEHLTFGMTIQAMREVWEEKKRRDRANYYTNKYVKPYTNIPGNKINNIVTFFQQMQQQMKEGRDLEIAVLKSLDAASFGHLDSYDSGLAYQAICFQGEEFTWFAQVREQIDERLLHGIQWDQNNMSVEGLDCEVFPTLQSLVERILEMVHFASVRSVLSIGHKWLYERTYMNIADSIMSYLEKMNMSDMLTESDHDYFSGVVGSSGVQLSMDLEMDSDYLRGYLWNLLRLEVIATNQYELLDEGYNYLDPIKRNDTLTFASGEQLTYFDLAWRLGQYDMVDKMLNYKVAKHRTTSAEGIMRSVDRTKSTDRLVYGLGGKHLHEVRKRFELVDGILVKKNRKKRMKQLMKAAKILDFGIEKRDKDMTHVSFLKEKDKNEISFGNIKKMDMYFLDNKPFTHYLTLNNSLSPQDIKGYVAWLGNDFDLDRADDRGMTAFLTSWASYDIKKSNFVDLALEERWFWTGGIWGKRSDHAIPTLYQKIDDTVLASVIHLMAHHDEEMIRHLFDILENKICISFLGENVMKEASMIKGLLLTTSAETKLTGLQTLAEYGHTALVEELMGTYDLDLWGLEENAPRKKRIDIAKEVMDKIGASTIASVEVYQWFYRQWMHFEFSGDHMFVSRDDDMLTERGLPPGDYIYHRHRDVDQDKRDDMMYNIDEKQYYSSYLTYIAATIPVQKKKWRVKKIDVPVLPKEKYIRYVKRPQKPKGFEDVTFSLGGFLSFQDAYYSPYLHQGIKHIDAVIQSGNIAKLEYVLSQGLLGENFGTHVEYCLRIIDHVPAHIQDGGVPKIDARIEEMKKMISLLRHADQVHTKRYEKHLDADTLERVRTIVAENKKSH